MTGRRGPSAPEGPVFPKAAAPLQRPTGNSRCARSGCGQAIGSTPHDSTHAHYAHHRSGGAPHGIVVGGDDASQHQVKRLLKSMCAKFEATLKRQQLESQRMLHRLADHYEEQLAGCTCARTARRDKASARSHVGLSAALAQFEQHESELVQEIASVDARVEMLLRDGVASRKDLADARCDPGDDA